MINSSLNVKKDNFKLPFFKKQFCDIIGSLIINMEEYDKLFDIYQNSTKDFSEKKGKSYTYIFFQIHATIRYSSFPELVSIPYPNQTLKVDFSKSPRQKLKLNIYSCRASLTLSEYNFTFKLCQVLFEKSIFKDFLGYGTETSSGKEE